MWADIRPDEEHGFVLALVVRNDGRTVATGVRLTFDKPLPNEFSNQWDSQALSLSSIAPNRQLVWWLKPGPAWYNSDLPRAFTATIDCNGPFGPAPPLAYMLSINDFGDEQPTKRGSMFAMTEGARGDDPGPQEEVTHPASTLAPSSDGRADLRRTAALWDRTRQGVAAAGPRRPRRWMRRCQRAARSLANAAHVPLATDLSPLHTCCSILICR